jgi:hypothetical protein
MMGDMLHDGAEIPAPFSVDAVASQLGSQFTAREALAVELIRDLAMKRYRDELVDEVKEMLSQLTDQGLQILLATAMRFPDYGMLELYNDVLHLQEGREVSDGNSIENPE